MSKTSRKTSSRKNIHLDLARRDEAQSGIGCDWDMIRLTHQALPELNFDEIDLTAYFLGKKLAMPMMVGAMTGGTDRADAINRLLAEAAQEAKIGLAVGSQRAGLEEHRQDPDLRSIAPDIPIIGNLGGVQLAKEGGLDLAKRAAETLQADAMAIHLNPLQEMAQPEGDRDWRGILAAIEDAVRSLPCPIIVKEVGAGISSDVAGRLFAAGVQWIEIAGLGGTNWTRIETMRRAEEDQDVMTPFLDWGNTTLDSLIAIKEDHPTLRLIASGGVRNGLDAAKAIWMGAEMAAAAGPMLKAAEDDKGKLTPERLHTHLEDWKTQMAMALFLTGSPDLNAFKDAEGMINI